MRHKVDWPKHFSSVECDSAREAWVFASLHLAKDADLKVAQRVELFTAICEYSKSARKLYNIGGELDLGFRSIVWHCCCMQVKSHVNTSVFGELRL